MTELTRTDRWEPVEPGLLLALLHVDERMRSGQVPLDPPESLTPDQLAELEDAAQAMRELELQYPRRPTGSPSRALAGHPDRIGRFRIDGVLGAGGCAVVYKAHDELLDRRVAIKVPRFHALASPEIRRRFVREAHAAAQLDHTHIVPIYEAGEFRDIPYIAYAYCDGPTLSQWVKQADEPMRPALAAQLVRELAEAVQYSHDQGILHRDIKPSNVLLFPQNPPEHIEFPFSPRLSDLGLAKMIESELEDTATDVVMGTPLYMAPEQAEGRPEDVGRESDIYSLGALLFFLLTGRPPFVAASLMETLKQVISQDPILPSVLNPMVDRELNIICLKCLEKSASCRYTSARALAEDLRRYLAGVPILARPASWAHRARRWAQRNPLAATLAVGVVTLVVGLVGSLVWNNANSRAFGSQLQRQNRELQAALQQMDAALHTVSQQRELGEQQRRRVEQLLYATDMGIASSAWLRHDPREAARVLRDYSPRQSAEDPREFTWYLLQQQLSGIGQKLGQADESLWDVEYLSGTGQIVWTGSRGTVAVWSKEQSTAPVWRVNSGQHEVNSIALTADGRLAATGGDDGTLAIWNLATGESVSRFPVFADGKHVYAVGYLRDPARWVACGQSTTIGIFLADTGRPVEQLTWDGQRAVECLTVAPDGNRFATGGTAGGVALWEAGKTEPVRKFTSHRGACSAVCFSADGQWLYSAGGDGTVRLHHVASGELRRSFRRPDAIHALAVSTAGLVACGDRGGIVSLLATDTADESSVADESGADDSGPDESSASKNWSALRMWAASEARVTTLAFAPDGAQLLSGDALGGWHVWQVSPGTPRVQLPPLDLEARKTANQVLAPGRVVGEFVRASDAGLEARLVAGGRLQEMLIHDRAVSAVDVLIDGRGCLLGDADGNVGELSWRNVGGVRWRSVFPGIETEQVFAVPRSRRVVAISEDAELVYLDLDSGTVLKRIPSVSAFCISPRADWAAMSFHGSNRLVLVSPLSLDIIQELATHQSTIATLCSTPGGEGLVVGSHDRTAVLWDARTWRDPTPLLGHAEGVNAVTVSPDGKTIATGDDAGTLRLWHAVVGRQLAEIPLGRPAIRSLVFDHDSTSLLVGRANGTTEILAAPRAIPATSDNFMRRAEATISTPRP